MLLTCMLNIQGYIWGQTLEPLFEVQQRTAGTRGFDVVIMSDLIFNHSQVCTFSVIVYKTLKERGFGQHDALLKTAENALRAAHHNEDHAPCVLVFYSHHRPHLAHRDMEFFTKAKDRGWHCEEILTEKFPVVNPSPLHVTCVPDRKPYCSRCFLKTLVRRRYALRCTVGGSRVQQERLETRSWRTRTFTGQLLCFWAAFVIILFEAPNGLASRNSLHLNEIL